MNAVPRYQPTIGQRERRFVTPEERADYESAFAAYPCPPVPFLPASRLGYADAANALRFQLEAA